ncbi:hypothetical protein BDZ89DRAFT_1045425 [Hymenopellis radicata]|nr:hypothetical protein BDZ89DRAFT_1045425 [Hymenopellis radicata]
MPGGRPRKTRHAGGRPLYTTPTRPDKLLVKHHEINGTLIHGESCPDIIALETPFISYRVHKRVKKQMRTRYHENREVDEGGQSQTFESAVACTMTPNTHPEHAETSALEAARNVQQRFDNYIESSDQVFLKRTLRRVQKNYTPGEASPLLDRIQDDISEMEREVEVYLGEVLNILGAWAEEYYEVQGIRDGINAMEGTLEEAVNQRQFTFLK